MSSSILQVNRRFPLAIVFSLGCVLASSVAAAQTADPQSEALIEQGVARRQAGDDDGALVLFRQAYERSQSARALAQMALAEQAIGNWVAADEHLRAVLQLTNDPWIARNQQALEGALQQINHRIGTLDVRCPLPNAELWVDGRRVGSLPRPVPVRLAAGTVMVEVRAEGYVTQRRNVLVVAEQNGRENFTLVPGDSGTTTAQQTGNSQANSTQSTTSNNSGNGGANSGSTTAGQGSATTPNPPPPSGGSVPVGSVVVIGAGVLSLGLAPVFGTLRSGAIGTCVIRGSVLECPTADDAMRAQNGRTYTTLVNVTLVAGSALVVGGAVWLIAGLMSGRRQEHAQVFVRPTIAVGTDGFTGLSVEGRF